MSAPQGLLGSILGVALGATIGIPLTSLKFPWNVVVGGTAGLIVLGLVIFSFRKVYKDGKEETNNKSK